MVSRARNGRAVAVVVVVVVVFAHHRPFLLLPDHHRQVAEQGLRPDMALRACNNPKITSPILSREITRLVNECAKDAVDRLLQKRKADAAGGIGTLGQSEGGAGEAGGGASDIVTHAPIAAPPAEFCCSSRMTPPWASPCRRPIDLIF